MAASSTREPRHDGPLPFPSPPPLRIGHVFEPTKVAVRIALREDDFTGHVEITCELTNQDQVLWLNALGLTDVRATATSASEVVPLEVSQAFSSKQMLGLRAPGPLHAGTWTLALDYTGHFHDEVRLPFGVFRRLYRAETYYATQSEAIGARAIFPCIDEPDRKVPWQLTLDVPAGLLAASNAPIARETAIAADYKRVEFAPTRPLPSYLIAFAVGPFDVIDLGTAKDGTPVRALALQGRRDTVADAARVVPLLLDTVSAWLDVPYAYGKLDLVDVRELGFGAMENPGLITVADEMFDLHGAPEDAFAHEVAHLWFGDLVTPAWWDDVWLNESFARFLAEELSPAGAGLTADALGERLAAPDRLAAAPSVQTWVQDLDDLASNRFSPPRTVSRGLGWLGFAQAKLGAERFRAGLHAYVVAHADRTATSEDLVRALAAAADAPIEGALRDLLDGTLPLVTATLDCTSSPRVHLSANHTPVHACVAYDHAGQRAKECATITDHARELLLPSRTCPRWILPNADGNGLYAVAWTPELLHPLLAIGWPTLTRDERRAVFGEALASGDHDADALAKMLSTSDATRYPQELDVIQRTRRYVADDLRDRFDAWVRARYAPLIASLDLDDVATGARAVTYDQLRAILALALAGEPRVIAEARRRFARGIATEVPPLDEAWFGAVANVDAAAADLLVTADPRDEQARYRRNNGLPHVRAVVAAFARHPGAITALGHDEARSIFAGVCDPAARAQLAALFGSSHAPAQLLERIDRCIADRPRYDRVLRAALAPHPP